MLIENPSTSVGSFAVALDWVWETVLSVENANESAGVDLELAIALIDDQFDLLFSDTPISVSRVTALGDFGVLGDANALTLEGALAPGESWNLVIDLFAIDGRAQSELAPTRIPAPAPLALVLPGAMAIGTYRSRHAQ